MKKLPNRIVAFIENEGTDDECLLAYEQESEIAEIGVRKKAGIYKLERTVTVEGETKVT